MHMFHRSAKFASALLVGFLVNAPLVTTSYSAAPAADDCLSGPKDQTPAGSHWYYRIERGTKRHCWYLKGENDKVSQAAPADSAATANPVSPSVETPTPRSVADARAELPLPQTRFEPQQGVGVSQRVVAPTVNAAGPVNSPAPAAQDANPRTSVIASRWPDPSSVSVAADPVPATDNSDADANSGDDAQTNVAPPPVAVAEVPLAAADSSAVKPPVAMRTLLLVVIGALALAGLTASSIFRLANRQRNSRRPIRRDRRAIWDSVAVDRPSQPNYQGPRARIPQADFPRELRAANDPDERIPDDRITEMLARLARSSMN
jgi:hypothetical protein